MKMRRPLPAALPVGAGLVTLGSAALIVGGRVPATYAALSPAAGGLTIATGALLLTAGAGAWRSGLSGATGPLLLFLSLVWWAPTWVGWEDGPALVPSLGLLLAPFTSAVLVHLAAGSPAGVVTAPLRWLVGAGWAVTGACAGARAFLRDPFLDRNCWVNCTDNLFLVDAQPELAAALDAAWAPTVTGLSLLAAGVAGLRLANSTPVGRRRRLPVLGPLVLAALAEAGYGIALWTRPLENPLDPVYQLIFVAKGLTLTLLALGCGYGVLVGRRRVLALARIAEEGDDTDADPDSDLDLEGRVAHALGDPTLRLLFPLADGRYIDQRGRPLHPGSNRRAAVPVRRGTQDLALVEHDPSLVSAAEVIDGLRPTSALALDNARLRAHLHARVHELRESRTRVVTTADAARQQLERDLHDGAQQRLLALLFELRLAATEASSNREFEKARQINRAVQMTERVVDEVRQLAWGLYPAVLDQAGLVAAVRDLAQQASVPVRLCLPDKPLEACPGASRTSERTAYLIVQEGIAQAEAAAAPVTVELRRAADSLVVRVAAFSAQRPPEYLIDRVGAAGGELRVQHETLTAEVPCE
jgi:signal transduction histidine kinase